MKKTSVLFLGASLLSGSLFAGTCSDSLHYDFTFYGAKDKSYVVTKNTFKKFEANFPNEKLLNATIKIDAFSLDTSADMRNGATAKWPAAMANVRNMNTINNFFKKFSVDAGVIEGKITSVDDKKIVADIKMNGVTKSIPFSYEVKDGKILAKGELDVLAFNTNKAWEQFERVCKMSFHKGKSWTNLDVYFQLDASCK